MAYGDSTFTDADAFGEFDWDSDWQDWFDWGYGGEDYVDDLGTASDWDWIDTLGEDYTDTSTIGSDAGTLFDLTDYYSDDSGDISSISDLGSAVNVGDVVSGFDYYGEDGGDAAYSSDAGSIGDFGATTIGADGGLSDIIRMDPFVVSAPSGDTFADDFTTGGFTNIFDYGAGTITPSEGYGGGSGDISFGEQATPVPTVNRYLQPLPGGDVTNEIYNKRLADLNAARAARGEGPILESDADVIGGLWDDVQKQVTAIYDDAQRDLDRAQAARQIAQTGGVVPLTLPIPPELATILNAAQLADLIGNIYGKSTLGLETPLTPQDVVNQGGDLSQIGTVGVGPVPAGGGSVGGISQMGNQILGQLGGLLAGAGALVMDPSSILGGGGGGGAAPTAGTGTQAPTSNTPVVVTPGAVGGETDTGSSTPSVNNPGGTQTSIDLGNTGLTPTGMGPFALPAGQEPNVVGGETDEQRRAREALEQQAARDRASAAALTQSQIDAARRQQEAAHAARAQQELETLNRIMGQNPVFQQIGTTPAVNENINLNQTNLPPSDMGPFVIPVNTNTATATNTVTNINQNSQTQTNTFVSASNSQGTYSGDINTQTNVSSNIFNTGDVNTNTYQSEIVTQTQSATNIFNTGDVNTNTYQSEIVTKTQSATNIFNTGESQSDTYSSQSNTFISNSVSGENTQSSSNSVFSNSVSGEKTYSSSNSVFSNTVSGEQTQSSSNSVFSNTVSGEKTYSSSNSVFSNTVSGEKTNSSSNSVFSNSVSGEKTYSSSNSVFSNSVSGEKTNSSSNSVFSNSVSADKTYSSSNSVFSNSVSGEKTYSSSNSVFSNSNSVSNETYTSNSTRSYISNSSSSNKTSSSGTPGSSTNIFTLPISTYTPSLMATTPAQRNILTEGTTTTGAFTQLAPQFGDMYGGLASRYQAQDVQRLYDMAAPDSPFMKAQLQLSQAIAEQNARANEAQRQANLRNVEEMQQRALEARKKANPELYAALEQLTQQAKQQAAADYARMGTAGQLSAEDIRNAQQAAREAYGARGQAMSKGAVGAEILNRQALQQQREQQARQNYQQSLGNLGAATQMQTANVFDPFATLLGQQYGMQTQNVGTTQGLFGQAGALASGGLSYAPVVQTYNPFGVYPADVYGTNVNALNADQIAAANRQAALEAAKMGQTGSYAQALGTFLGTQTGQSSINSIVDFIRRSVGG